MTPIRTCLSKVHLRRGVGGNEAVERFDDARVVGLGDDLVDALETVGPTVAGVEHRDRFTVGGAMTLVLPALR